MWLSTLVLGFSLFLLTGCSFSTEQFNDLKMASDIDENNLPTVITSVFQTNTPIIYLTGTINHALIDDMISVEWYCLDTDPDTFIGDSSLQLIDIDTQFYFSLTKPTNGWPIGDCEVLVYYGENLMGTITFKVN